MQAAAAQEKVDAATAERDAHQAELDRLFKEAEGNLDYVTKERAKKAKLEGERALLNKKLNEEAENELEVRKAKDMYAAKLNDYTKVRPLP